MDNATIRMNHQRIELEKEQDACISLMKKIEQEEEWQYQSNLVSNRKLDDFIEFWGSDPKMQYCLEEIQEKQYAANREICQVQERRSDYIRESQGKWADRENKIYNEYKKGLEEMNE